MLAKALSVSRDEAGVMSAVTVNHRSVVVGVPDQLFERFLSEWRSFPAFRFSPNLDWANAMRALALTCV